MRGGGGTVQQTLTAEAASVVKQAVALARRRGHAHVTPLHVANTMLASSTGLLRTACLQSHSHPLQCRVLEVCFNVALNRLPASTSSPMFGTQHPSISNALVAAFKRAQARQRRGSIENQQQPLLVVKIELEQLTISILDDPSVSRVMREAGFSSTQVKSNVEQAVSLEICSESAPSVSSKSKETNALTLSHSPLISYRDGAKGSNYKVLDPIRNEGIASVIEQLMNKKKRSIVIVGECLNSMEGVLQGVMEKVNKGDVPDSLKGVKFLKFSASSFGQLSRAEVENKLEELKANVRSYMSVGVILNLGDLKWVADYRASSSNEQRRDFLCPMELMIMELGRLACGVGEKNGRFWLLGIATFQAYMKCKSSYPSIETLWGLHALTVPADSLRLSLITDSDIQSRSTSNKAENGSSWTILEGIEEKQPTCCAGCTVNFSNEARSIQCNTSKSDPTSSSLPSWLQQYKNESMGHSSNDQDCVSTKDPCKKWNSFCNSVHPQCNITFSSVSPLSSTSVFSYDKQYPNLHQTHYDWPMAETNQCSWRDENLWIGSETMVDGGNNVDSCLRVYIPEPKDHLKQPFSSSSSSAPNSTSSSDVMEMEYRQKFKELNAENLKTLCNGLESKVPSQKDVIPEIASTILQCRSGMSRRKGKVRSSEAKEETWLVFQGIDMEAKQKMAKELARLVFGSHNSFVSIALSSFSTTRADSTEDCRNKRSRDEQSRSYIERLSEAVSSNPHRVFLVEDVEQADYFSQMGFKRAIERGRISNANGEDVSLSDAIIILSCESFSSMSIACSPPVKRKTDSSNQEIKGSGAVLGETSSPCLSLDLNISIDDDVSEDQSIDEIDLLECVDRQIMFKIQEL